MVVTHCWNNSWNLPKKDSPYMKERYQETMEEGIMSLREVGVLKYIYSLRPENVPT